eukprot:11419509-Ditylum_brightwellii.AAC.1
MLRISFWSNMTVLGFSLDDVALRKLHQVVLREMASNIQALGPCRLLLSVAVVPTLSPSLITVVGSASLWHNPEVVDDCTMKFAKELSLDAAALEIISCDAANLMAA